MNGGVELVVPQGAKTIFEAYVCKKPDPKATPEAWNRERSINKSLRNEFPSIGCKNGEVEWNSHYLTRRNTGASICKKAPDALCTPVGETEEDVPTRVEETGSEMCDEQRDMVMEDLRALNKLSGLLSTVVHFDVKPPNILRAPPHALRAFLTNGSRLIDFGQSLTTSEAKKGFQPSGMGTRGFMNKAHENPGIARPEHDKISLLFSAGERVRKAFDDDPVDHRELRFGVESFENPNLLQTNRLAEGPLGDIKREQLAAGGKVAKLAENSDLDLGVRRLMGDKAWKMCGPGDGVAVDARANTLPGVLVRELKKVAAFL